MATRREKFGSGMQFLLGGDPTLRAGFPDGGCMAVEEILLSNTVTMVTFVCSDFRWQVALYTDWTSMVCMELAPVHTKEGSQSTRAWIRYD